jgi:serine/threonine protein kinase
VADGVWVPEGTLTLPYGTLRTLHQGVSEVRLLSSAVLQTKRVGKRISLLGREDTLAVHEALLLQSIEHPNVAKVFDVAEIAGTDPTLSMFEIIMPYYEQGSVLDAMIKSEARFRAAEARDIAVRSLRGIAHLHDQHRILHRDIKPANLFLSNDASLVKVGDLGEAMRMDSAGMADPLLIPQYWSPPETFTGSRYGVTSEIYSMGMALRELLSGPLPYDDYTRETLGERLAEGRCPVLPRHLRFQPHVPEGLRHIVRKATYLDPGRRYQSADEMIGDLLRARFVDWNWPDVVETEFVWQGEWRGSDYRVRCRRVRGTWRARAERHYAGGWRKIPQAPEVDRRAPLIAAEVVFAQIDKHLVST